MFRRTAEESGFTLVEMMAAMTVFGVVVTMAMMSYRSYDRTASHRGSARETVAVLRNAQVKAVSEAATYQCSFVQSTAGGPVDKLNILNPGGSIVKTYTLRSNLSFVATGTTHGAAHGFTHSSTTGNTNCFFYPRGTATGGTVGIRRADNSTEYDVKVEALTARVSYCEVTGGC
ncbi:MAG: pilus assembly FimT family protein [Actinomycetota bacterium]